MMIHALINATADHVIYQANQIGRNFECLGPESAASSTANHIKLYWGPLLRRTLLNEARARPHAFSPTAKNAIALLSQAPATA